FHHLDAVRPVEVHSVLADVGIVAYFSIRPFEPSRRAARGRIAPRQPADGKFDARPELRQFDGLGPFDIGQFPALQNEDAIGTLGEHALPRSPSPLLIARQPAQWL